MKSMIQKRNHIEDIKKQAVIDGMTTLMQDGIRKIFSGETDMIQVRKVCM